MGQGGTLTKCFCVPGRFSNQTNPSEQYIPSVGVQENLHLVFFLGMGKNSENAINHRV